MTEFALLPLLEFAYALIEMWTQDCAEARLRSSPPARLPRIPLTPLKIVKPPRGLIESDGGCGKRFPLFFWGLPLVKNVTRISTQITRQAPSTGVDNILKGLVKT